ncbi:MAG: nuclear transport factor 2 family protein [Streptomycetales bacterium]
MISDVEAVVDANADLYAAVETADLDRMGRIWADGPYAESVTCVHPGWPPLRGRDEVMRSWAVIMANTPYIQFFLTDVQVELAGDVAVLTCAENILTSLGENDDDDADVDASSALAGGRIVATNIFRRTSEGWRLWLHHGSPVLNAADSE